jgi:hypothetical protein
MAGADEAMTERAVRWEGTDASWRAVVELHAGLEMVAFSNDDHTLDVETARGREQMPVGWWLVRRDPSTGLRAGPSTVLRAGDGSIEVQPPRG